MVRRLLLWVGTRALMITKEESGCSESCGERRVEKEQQEEPEQGYHTMVERLLSTVTAPHTDMHRHAHRNITHPTQHTQMQHTDHIHNTHTPRNTHIQTPHSYPEHTPMHAAHTSLKTQLFIVWRVWLDVCFFS